MREAHRTTGGDLGNFLMAGLPNASYIGFTGTPVDKTAFGNGLERDAPATCGVDHWRDREEFKARVAEWARKLSVEAHSIYVRPMRRKWASCSTAGTLSFNDELLEMERELGDYVIVHELLHFSVPNHGKLWKCLMRAHLGDYERLEERLGRSEERS